MANQNESDEERYPQLGSDEKKKKQEQAQKAQQKQEKQEERKEKVNKIVGGLTLKALSPIIVPALLGIFGFLMSLVIMLAPIMIVAGGIMEITDKIKGWVDTVVEAVTGDNSEIIIGNVDVDYLLEKIPNYAQLDVTRQNILRAGAEVIASNYPYKWGGHPSGPGLKGVPSTGLDCAGFVQYALWTGTGSSPGYLTTGTIDNQIGTNFIQVDCIHAKPGDIGLKRHGGSTKTSTNHTGIYAGNGLWMHAASSNTGIVMSTYSNFTICLRYKGVPD